jgi:hypothetical protein
MGRWDTGGLKVLVPEVPGLAFARLQFHVPFLPGHQLLCLSQRQRSVAGECVAFVFSSGEHFTLMGCRSLSLYVAW